MGEEGSEQWIVIQCMTYCSACVSGCVVNGVSTTAAQSFLLKLYMYMQVSYN